MPYEFVAVFEKKDNIFIGYIEEMPGVNLQGHSLEETRQDLKEAIELVATATKELVEKKVSSARPGGILDKRRGIWPLDTDLTRHLARQGCILHRKGKKYSVYIHPHSGKVSTVPHAKKIEDSLAQKICSDLDILKLVHS